MCDFDLRDAFESSPDLDDSGFESSCFDMTKLQHETFSLDEGLDLVVSHNPGTLQCVANLVVAINRMKKPLSKYSRQLSGDELCSVIMDSLVDETIVEDSFSQKKIYHRENSVNTVSLSDRSKKDIIYDSRELKLQAITLQGGHCDRKVHFQLSRYSQSPICDRGSPVVLSITNNNLYMSCTMEGSKAVLKLEECSEEELTRMDDEKLNRLLFYRNSMAIGWTTFESVSCQGWFISTYEEENQPLEMSTVDSARCYFSVNWV